MSNVINAYSKNKSIHNHHNDKSNCEQQKLTKWEKKKQI